MTITTTKSLRHAERSRARTARIARRVAAVAGAAGAAVAGEAEAAGITYAPTAGVVAAQGIPGFSFTAPTTVTSGTLRPPASSGINGWDIDGNGQVDFNLQNNAGANGVLIPLAPFSFNPNGLLLTTATSSGPVMRNLANAAAVGPSAALWDGNGQFITAGTGLVQSQFAVGQPGYFGFRFAFNNSANSYYYGWASLTADLSGGGQGFKVTEAFYQSTPNAGINVGAVPVPEPSSMALLAAGAAGVTAWRARRKLRAAGTGAASSCAIQPL